MECPECPCPSSLLDRFDIVINPLIATRIRNEKRLIAVVKLTLSETVPSSGTSNFLMIVLIFVMIVECAEFRVEYKNQEDDVFSPVSIRWEVTQKPKVAIRRRNSGRERQESSKGHETNDMH